MEKNTKEITFTVDSQLMQELGERLVSKNYIALAELIKNSYDADATQIDIYFEDVSEKNLDKSKIIIKDNGHGMSLDKIEKYWMRVATSNKRDDEVSPKFGRPRTGNKGVGRFSCQKLGKALHLETIGFNEKKKSFESSDVFFDWLRFKPGSNLSEIKFETNTINDNNPKTKTILTISNLSQKWNKSEFNTFKRHILMLSVSKDIERDGFEKDPGMKIVIHAPEFEDEKNIDLYQNFLESGWGLISTNIDENGKTEIILDAKLIGIRKKKLPITFDKLNGIELNISWVAAGESKKYNKNPDIVNKESLEFAREFGGVKVYFNDFRVYPYGSEGNDWLDLDKDRSRSASTITDILKEDNKDLGLNDPRPLLALPTNKNLFGGVYIRGEASKNFIIKIDREGFDQETQSYKQLKELVRLVIQWTTLQYVFFKEHLQKLELEAAAADFNDGSDSTSDNPNTEDSNPNPSTEDSSDSGNQTDSTNDDDEPNPTTGGNNESSPNPTTTTPPNEKKTSFSFEKVESAINYMNKLAEINADKENKEKLNSAKKYINSYIGLKNSQLTSLRSIAALNSVFLTFAHESKNIILTLARTNHSLKNVSKKVSGQDLIEINETMKTIDAAKDRFLEQMELFKVLSTKVSNSEEKKYFIKNLITDIELSFKYILEKYKIKINYDSIKDELKTPKMFKAEFYTILINLLSNSIKASLANNGQEILIESYKKDGELILKVYDKGVGISDEYITKVFEPVVYDPENKIYDKLESLHDDLLIAFGQGNGLGLSIVKDILDNRSGSIVFINKDLNEWKTCVEVKLKC